MPVRGVAKGGWADKVLGQRDFTEITPGQVDGSHCWLPHGCLIDHRASPQLLFVYDAGNNRVPVYDWDACLASTQDPISPRPLAVLGQPSSVSSAGNGDSGFQDYPFRAPATRHSLCGHLERVLSPSESGSGASMALDSLGNLYVPDYYNYRVLQYMPPFYTGMSASAIDMWGQDNFAANWPNHGRGEGAVGPDGFDFGWGGCNAWTAGVDVSRLGELLVTDSGNHRVLRFPPGSKTPNLVLGQQHFTSRVPGSALNQMSSPVAVRVTPEGWVLVADQCNNRVLRFKPPFSNGMAGEVLLTARFPAGLDLDPTDPGGVWITKSGQHVLDLVDYATGIFLRRLGIKGNGNLLGDATGSLGVDRGGNVVVALGTGHYDNDVILFRKDGPTDVPSKRLFGRSNLKSASRLSAAPGLAIHADQLIVADRERLLAWNGLETLTSGKDADVVTGFDVHAGTAVDSFTDYSKRAPGGYRMVAAGGGYVWASAGVAGDVPNRLEAYALPLTTGQLPATWFGTMRTLEGEEMRFGSTPEGIAVSPDGRFLWVSDPVSHRVLRIREPLLLVRRVDVVLGQDEPSGILPNRGGAAGLNTLAYPGTLALDRLGNLWVSEHVPEVSTNKRMTMFAPLPTDNVATIYGPPAARIIPNVITNQPAFDSRNRMAVGYDAYWTGNPGGGWFIGLYHDPLIDDLPAVLLKDYVRMPIGLAFDERDWFYLSDTNSHRILVYHGLPETAPAPVEPPVEPPAVFIMGLMIKPGSARIKSRRTRQLQAMAIGSDAMQTDVTGPAAWDSDNPAIATVEDGLVTARFRGVVVIRAIYEGVTAACVVTVFGR